MVDGSNRLCLFAAAKVNLYLHVTGRCANGYHTLDSLVAFAGVGDTVTVTPDVNISLEVSGPFAENVPRGSDNLVMVAARRLAKAAGHGNGARIELCKRLPVAAGIGGGSADAAAAIRALMKMWKMSMGHAEIMELALSLGADVPVCMGAKSAAVGGIGDEIKLTKPLPAVGLVLVNPMLSLDTAKVFAAFAGPLSSPAPFEAAPSDAVSLAAMLKERRNDLTGAAIELAPKIDEVLTRLQSLPGTLLSRMSGSGATCFAIFKDIGVAQAAADKLALSRPEWWVRATVLPDNEEHHNSAGCA